jgi:hypothetical protein
MSVSTTTNKDIVLIKLEIYYEALQELDKILFIDPNIAEVEYTMNVWHLID